MPTPSRPSDMGSVAGAGMGAASARGEMGGKTIGYWGGIALNINNIMGPAMVALPFLNQEAGWVPCLVVLGLCCALSSLSATMLCEAMQRIPGNREFAGRDPSTGRRYEFCDVVRHYAALRYGAGERQVRRWYTAAQVFFNTSLQASNIAAMVVCAQILDDLCRFKFHWAGALRYDVWPPEFITSAAESHSDSLWPTPWVISVGYIAAATLCIPFGLLNLDENMWFQWLSFYCLIFFVAEFCVQYTWLGPTGTQDRYLPVTTGNTQAFTDISGQSRVVGVIAFSYAFVVTVPSWVNEKRKGVSVNKSVWISCVCGLVLKFVVGLFGSWAYRLSGDDKVCLPADCQNILLVMDVEVHNPAVTVWSSYMFMVTTLVPGIPVLAIIVRYNLLSGGVCSPTSATWWGVIAPWFVTLFLCNTAAFTTVLNWAAMLCMGFINFAAPPMLFREALLRYPTAAEVRRRPKLVETAALLGHADGCSESPDMLTAGSCVSSPLPSIPSPSVSLPAASPPPEADACVGGYETEEPLVDAVPEWLRDALPGLDAEGLAWLAFAVMLSITLVAIGINVVYAVFLHQDLVS